MRAEKVGCITFEVYEVYENLKANLVRLITTPPGPHDIYCKPLLIVDRALMTAALEEDALYRRTISWPEVSYETVVSVANLFGKNCRGLSDDLCRLTSGGHFSLQIDEKVAIVNLKTFFPRIDMILGFGKGNIVVAGGVFTTTNRYGLNLRKPPKDCDFFFWGLKSTFDAESIVKSICLQWLSMPGTKVYRSDHVTTLTEENADGDVKAYQIIHRIYPNKMSIIGGFDLAPCMCLYDGDSILFTPLSALSYAFSFFFVDISRQSKSFSARISKYTHRGFAPVIACKPYKDIYNTIRDFGILPANGNMFIRIAPTYGITMSDTFVKTASSQLMHEAEIQTEDYDVGIDVRSKSVLRFANSKLLASGQLENVTKLVGLPDLEPVKVSRCFKYIMNFADKVEHYSTLKRGIITRIKSYYGERANFITESSDTLEVANFMRANFEFLRTKMEDAVGLVLSKSEVSWMGIDENPSRQLFTSSFRPVMQNGAWISPAYAKPLYIGVPFEVYKMIWIGKRQKSCLFSWFCRDLFRYFMNMLRSIMAPESPIQTLLNLINVAKSEIVTIS